MNYVIGKSIFGDYWINKTEEKVEGKINCDSFKDAQEIINAMNLTVDNYAEIDVGEKDYFEEAEKEFLRKEMYKWLI